MYSDISNEILINSGVGNPDAPKGVGFVTTDLALYLVIPEFEAFKRLPWGSISFLHGGPKRMFSRISAVMVVTNTVRDGGPIGHNLLVVNSDVRGIADDARRGGVAKVYPYA